MTVTSRLEPGTRIWRRLVAPQWKGPPARPLPRHLTLKNARRSAPFLTNWQIWAVLSHQGKRVFSTHKDSRGSDGAAWVEHLWCEMGPWQAGFPRRRAMQQGLVYHGGETSSCLHRIPRSTLHPFSTAWECRDPFYTQSYVMSDLNERNDVVGAKHLVWGLQSLMCGDGDLCSV